MSLKAFFVGVGLCFVATQTIAETEMGRKIEGRYQAELDQVKDDCPTCYRTAVYLAKLKEKKCLGKPGAGPVLKEIEDSPVYLTLMLASLKYGSGELFGDMLVGAEKTIVCKDDEAWNTAYTSWFGENIKSIVSMDRSLVVGSIDLTDEMPDGEVVVTGDQEVAVTVAPNTEVSIGESAEISKGEVDSQAMPANEVEVVVTADVDKSAVRELEDVNALDYLIKKIDSL